MKKNMLLISVIFLVFVVQGTAQSQSSSKVVDSPDVPRISAHEAYKKYKAGKAVLIHAGGEAFERRHIFGAFHAIYQGVLNGSMKLPNLPKDGVEIYTYCY